MSGRLNMGGDPGGYGMNIAKSFIPGKGYVPAVKAPRSELRSAVRDAAGKGPRVPVTSRGTHPRDNEMNNQMYRFNQTRVKPSGRKNIWLGEGDVDDHKEIMSSLPKKAKRPVVVHAGPANPALRGYALGRAGTKRPAHVVLSRGGMEPGIASHEIAHATPRRSQGRLSNVVEGSKTLSREEARADAAQIARQGRNTGSAYELTAARKKRLKLEFNGGEIDGPEYGRMRAKLGKPVPGRLEAERVAAVEGVKAVRNAQKVPFTRGMSNANDPLRSPKASEILKAETTMSEHHARKLVSQVGDRGPLPKTMSRQEKMRAYEARYVAAGGPKSEKWNQRAKLAGGVSAAGGGVAGASALGMLAARKRPRVRRAASTTSLLGTAGWGLGGLAAHDARKRRASYNSSPGGVAASALTRMRNYSPKE